MKREQIQWGTRTLPISQFDLRPSATDENWFFCNISLFSSRTPKDDRNEIYRLWSEPEHIEPEKDKGKGPLKREATQFPGMEARSSSLEKMEPQFFFRDPEWKVKIERQLQHRRPRKARAASSKGGLSSQHFKVERSRIGLKAWMNQLRLCSRESCFLIDARAANVSLI